MKKIIVMIVLTSMAYLGMAQRADSLLKNTIGMSLLSSINASFELSYERTTGNNSSVVFIPGVTLDDSYGNAQGFSTELQYRFRAMKEMRLLRYAFFAPFVKYQYVQVGSLDNYSYSYEPTNNAQGHDFNNLRMGAIVGLRSCIFSRMYIECSVGSGVNYALGSDGTTYQLGTMTLGESKVFSRTNVTIGVAF